LGRGTRFSYWIHNIFTAYRRISRYSTCFVRSVD
jgi:hypothetical protein